MALSKTILVVDDEVKIVEVVKSYLENAGFRVACAYTGAQALHLFEKESPALVLLDLMLPDISGENVCRAIRVKSNVPIIMLTAKTEDENVIQGLDIGADDYVTKPFSPRQLMARVEAVLRRSMEKAVSAVGEFIFDDGDLFIDDPRHIVRRGGETNTHTQNEYKIETTLAKHASKIFTRDELIAYALGDDFDGYDRVIDTHIKNIRLKLGDVSKSPKYIITVHGTGYRFGGEAT
jgi:DNA-binding response OmpR family regulator